MLHIKETIVVEGKYDKEQLKKVTDAPVLCMGGFDIYTNKDTVNTVRRIACKTGIIILTDSDRAGFRLRNYIKQCVGKEGIVKQAYIPTVEGKERRKRKAGKEGLLGVEGITEECLTEILTKVTEVKDWEKTDGVLVTKAMFYEDGFSGKEGSNEKRRQLARALGLPVRISANSMLEIINKVYSYAEYRDAVEKLKNK